MHQSLNSVNPIIVSKYPIDSCPPVSRVFHYFATLPRDQVVEKLPYFHVLSNVRGIIAEFVLEEGVGLGFLDEVDDTLRVTILTRIMQGGVFIRILHISIDWVTWITFNQHTHYICVSSDSSQM